MGISPSADGDKGLSARRMLAYAMTHDDPFEKGSIENFSFLDKNLKFCVLLGVVCAPALRVSANNTHN